MNVRRAKAPVKARDIGEDFDMILLRLVGRNYLKAMVLVFFFL